MKLNEEEIKREFKKRFIRQIIISPLLIGLILTLFYLIDQAEKKGEGSLLLIVLAGVGLLVAFAFSFKNWRCPSCQKYLGKAMNPRFCSKCGVALK